MQQLSLIAGVFAVLTMSTAYADDPPQPPRTHVDTTVVGDAKEDGAARGMSTDATGAQSLDNDHHFVPGAPDIVKVTRQLNLSPAQTAKVHDVIENADAGAAVLIKHELDEKQMIAATTPADPMYAKLIAHQTMDASLWTENRDSLKRDVLSVLTPAQRNRFQELQAHN